MSTLLLACAVCGAGQSPQDGAWVVMSVIISLMPIVLLGSIIGFVAYKHRRAQGDAESTATPAPRS